MRLSTSEGDAGYATWGRVNSLGATIRVFLDGEDVTNRCTMCDDEAGDVTLSKLGPDGEPYADPVTGNIAEETIHGVVIIDIDPVDQAVH